MPEPIKVVEGQLAQNRWMLGAEFGLVDCAYCPIFNVIDKAGFSLAEFPPVSGYPTRSAPARLESDTRAPGIVVAR